MHVSLAMGTWTRKLSFIPRACNNVRIAFAYERLSLIWDQSAECSLRTEPTCASCCSLCKRGPIYHNPQLSSLLLPPGSSSSTGGCWAHAGSSAARVAPEFGLWHHFQLSLHPHPHISLLFTQRAALSSLNLPRLSRSTHIITY